MIVIDTSAAIELVLDSHDGRSVRERLGDESVHAPQLLLVEAAQVLRRFAANGTMTARRAGEALGDLVDLDVELYDHALLIDRIWALRANLTAYDAAYVALAELLRAPLLTCDERLAGAPGHEARVEVPGRAAP